MVFHTLKHVDMIKNKGLWYRLVFAIIGAVVGLLYWKFVGCANGTCPIKSVWYFSTLWGMAMGYLIGDLVRNFMVRRGLHE
jgi:hypothetical protein